MAVKIITYTKLEPDSDTIRVFQSNMHNLIKAKDNLGKLGLFNGTKWGFSTENLQHAIQYSAELVAAAEKLEADVLLACSDVDVHIKREP